MRSAHFFRRSKSMATVPMLTSDWLASFACVSAVTKMLPNKRCSRLACSTFLPVGPLSPRRGPGPPRTSRPRNPRIQKPQPACSPVSWPPIVGLPLYALKLAATLRRQRAIAELPSARKPVESVSTVCNLCRILSSNSENANKSVSTVCNPVILSETRFVRSANLVQSKDPVFA